MYASLGHAIFEDDNSTIFALMDENELTHSLFRELGAYACMCFVFFPCKKIYYYVILTLRKRIRHEGVDKPGHAL